MKYIILLFCFPVNAADFYIRQMPVSEQLDRGFAIHFIDNDGKAHCLGIPELTDITRIPTDWTRVESAAQMFTWPVMLDPLSLECTVNGPVIPRTEGGPFFYLDDSFNVRWVPGGIPAGIECEVALGPSGAVRAVTYRGIKGFTQCQ
jgi:hypothetical protein